MTFDEFLASAVRVDDLGPETNDSCVDGVEGVVFHGRLWIEDTTTRHPTDTPPKMCRWFTQIGRDGYTSDNLAEVALPLYRWAVEQEIIGGEEW